MRDDVLESEFVWFHERPSPQMRRLPRSLSFKHFIFLCLEQVIIRLRIADMIFSADFTKAPVMFGFLVFELFLQRD